MFKKVMIANRGEIALRVMRACKDLGVSTTLVYSDADRDSLPVKLADEIYPLGSGLPVATYLNIEKILEAAKATRSDAIHPGYGFLSENHDFARACKKNGIVFIGPSAEVIQFLGDKVRARTTATKAGVHTTPGSKGVLKNADEGKKVAKDVGYPVVLKAVAGGGGRGMRVVNAPEDMDKLFQNASSEAQAAFGNGSLFLEKYILKPRHIEVQILGDGKGNVIHLFERECSIQRRHQKLLEESPSPALDPKTRARLTAAALRIARAVDYSSAGTLEFLYDDEDKHFYFMEANTRVQVEHPVTEFVTGVDIVREQIRIAAGAKLSILQKDVEQKGCAIECRITAEDPERGFAPTPGLIRQAVVPAGPGIRVDTAIYSGYEIPSIYDSLIAKVIAYGADRTEAIARMKRALSEFVVAGVKTLIPFHLALLDNEKFVKGEFTTRFLDTELKGLLARTEEEDLAGALIAAMHEMSRRVKGGVLQRQEMTGANVWTIAGRMDITRGKT